MTTGKIHLKDINGDPVESSFIAFSIDLHDGQYTAFVGESAISEPCDTQEECVDSLRTRFGGGVIIGIDDL